MASMTSKESTTIAAVSPATKPERMTPGLWALMWVALLLWASAFPGVREGLALAGERAGIDGYGAGELALLRFGTASLVLLAYALITRMKLPARSDLGRIALSGMFGFFGYHLLLNFGERVVESAPAAVLINTAPIFTAILATIFLKERVNLWGWLGIIISFVGAIIVAYGQGLDAASFHAETLLLLAAAFCTSLYFMTSKPILAKYSSVEFTTYAMWAGTLPMLYFAPSLFSQMQTVPTTSTIAGVYLGIFPAALAYVLWGIGLSRMTASRTTAFLNLQPLNAAVIAYFWGEGIPDALVIIGGVVAVAGVVLLNTLGKPKASPEQAATPEADSLEEMLDDTSEAAAAQI